MAARNHGPQRKKAPIPTAQWDTDAKCGTKKGGSGLLQTKHQENKEAGWDQKKRVHNAKRKKKKAQGTGYDLSCRRWTTKPTK